MIGDKTLFKSLKEKVGDYVTYDDGSHAQVLDKGTVEILALQQNVFLVMKISEEIFFVSKNIALVTKYEFRH